jgi:hypothetical protein
MHCRRGHSRPSALFDVAELLALAVALEIPPALLLFPTFPDGSVDVLPVSTPSTIKAREWLCGDAPLPVTVHAEGISGQFARPNMGVGLIGVVASRASIDALLANSRQAEQAEGTSRHAVESARRTTESLVEQLSSVERQIAEAQAALWGTSTEDLNDA